MRLKPGLLACLLFILTVSLHAQRTINVPADQPTIQAGINAANPGDTVLVAPGTYYENIDFQGKAITVTSAGGPAVTTIDGGSIDRVVSFTSGESRATTLSGFTIQHGGTYGLFSYLPIPPRYGGIYIAGSSPTIRGNSFSQNACWAIYSTQSAPLLQANTITSTLDQGLCDFATGAAVYIDGNLHLSKATNDGSAALLIGNTIEQNTDVGYTATGDDGGAAVYVYSGSPVIMNNIIRNNADPGGSGTAIAAAYGAFGLAIVQNLIYDNSSACGGGALGVGVNPDLRTGISVLLANNTIVDNTYSGGANGSSCRPIAQIYPDPVGYGSGVTPGAYLFLNNIVAGSTTYPAVDCDYFGTPSESTQASFESSILYNSAGPFFGTHCVDVSGQYGNIAVDPQFVNPSAGDYHLRSTSPAIDHGQNEVLQLFHSLTGLSLTTDLDGNPRIQDATGNGCIIDIGAYEYPGTKSVCGTLETLTSSLNPSIVGASITFTAQLSAANGTPTGSVQFSDGSTILGTETVSSSGIATLATTALSVGSHTITAAYQPMGSFPSATASLKQVVNGNATSTSLTSSLNPAAYGQPVTLSAHIASVSSAFGVPTGSVAFTDNTNALATVPLDGSGNAVFTTAALAANIPGSSHTISATYTPTGNFAGSTASLQQVIQGLPTMASLSATPSTANLGQAITLTAAVTPQNPPGPAAVTGTVTFLSGAITLGSANLANGTASLSTSTLPLGANTVTCTYSGDPVYAPSTCPPTTVTITGTPTTTTLTAAPNPAYQGQPITLTATVSSTSNVALTGPVTFYDGATALGTVPVTAAGQATLTTSTLAVGSHTLTAAYAANGALLGSTSAPATLTVLPSSFSITVAPTTLSLADGGQGTATLNLRSIGNFAGPLALTVGSIPAHTAATFSAATVNLAAGGTGTATLALNTAFATTARANAPPRPGTRSWPLITAAVLLLPLTATRSRRLRQLLLVLAAVALSQTLTGCTDLRVPYELTSPGTYQLPITALDANGNRQTATLTLVVTPR